VPLDDRRHPRRGLSPRATDRPARATPWFAENVEAGIPENGYPFAGEASGTAFVHPRFHPNALFLFDLGVVVLDEPVIKAEYGVLPALGELDTFKSRRGQQDDTVTAVGYGLQAASANHKKDVALRIRLQAVLDIVNLTGTAGIPGGTSVMVSGNHHTGGTCFGDFGGPMFLNDSNAVVAVASFGLNVNGAGVGGGYRVDQADDLDWVDGFLTPTN
jgi:hypothetical protein